MLFQLRKSRLRVIYIICVHLFAIIYLSLIFSGWLLCVVLLASMTVLYRYRGIFFREQSVVAMEYSRDREWLLHDVNGDVVRASLLPSSVMWRHLFILRFVDLNCAKRKTVVLFSDSVAREQYKSLRRCVRMGYL